MSTSPEKSARIAEAAMVVSALSAAEFVLEPAHPAISPPMPSARPVASIRRMAKLLDGKGKKGRGVAASALPSGRANLPKLSALGTRQSRRAIGSGATHPRVAGGSSAGGG